MWINCLPQIDEARACSPICNWTNQKSLVRPTTIYRTFYTDISFVFYDICWIRKFDTSLATRKSSSSSITSDRQLFTTLSTRTISFVFYHIPWIRAYSTLQTDNHLSFISLFFDLQRSLAQYSQSFHFLGTYSWHIVFICIIINFERSTLAVAFLFFDLFSP